MISMCALAGAGGLAEGSVVRGVWEPTGPSVNSATGRPSDNPSATRSHVLIGVLLCGEVFIQIEQGALCPLLDQTILCAQALLLRCEISPRLTAPRAQRQIGFESACFGCGRSYISVVTV